MKHFRKSTLQLSLAITLASCGVPAWALQLGHIQVKSALDEPLVAEIPIQLANLGEARGLSVGLASPADFAKVGLSRAGLESLHFSVITDSTGHKLVLVTSDQPVSDPYLDFLLQLNTNSGRQVREYTVLLDPVIASPAPEQTPATTPEAPVEQAAPVPMPAPLPQQSAAPAPARAPTQPQAQPQPAAPMLAPLPAPEQSSPRAVQTPPPVPAAAPASSHTDQYRVGKGDTLYHIARETRPDDQVSVDQMMLALQHTNPDAFYRDNINSLKSGAILRIPTHDAIDQTSAARASALVHKQYEDWRGTAARKTATVVQNAAPPAQPEASVAKPSAPASDRLALVPPSRGGGAAASRPGEKGGSSATAVAGLKQQLAASKESLTSLKQSNSDLQSRVKDLEDISNKNQKLLGLKDAQIAELQRKLAEAQQAATATPPVAAATAAPAPTASTGMAAAPPSGASAAMPTAATAGNPAPASTAPVSTQTPAVLTSKPVTHAAPRQPATAPRIESPQAQPWYQRPATWVIGAIILFVLIVLGLLRRRPRPLSEPGTEGPSLADHFGASPLAATPDDAAIEDVREQSLLAAVAEHPDDLDAHLALCQFYYERDDAQRFEAAAQTMHAHIADPAVPQWQDVLAMGGQLSPRHPLFAAEPLAGAAAVDDMHESPVVAEAQSAQDKYDFAFDELPPHESFAGDDDITREHAVPAFEDEHLHEPPLHAAAYEESAATVESDEATREHPVPAFSDDPVDTKLDLARAYLDMGDPAGARAMLEEVLSEGSQMQKDEARRLLDSMS